MQPTRSSARNTEPTAGGSGGGAKKGLSLAAKLAKLHSTPAPIPPGEERREFGFPVTFCGDTPQDNSYMDTWAEFFAEKRLRSVMNRCEKRRIKKLEPVEEFDDRVDLYTLYHQLNHYAIFGGSYRAGAVRIMKRLVGNYG